MNNLHSILEIEINFYYYSRGSITETQNHIEYGKLASYITESSAKKMKSKQTVK